MYERDRKGAIDSPQTVEIYFNFIGEYIPHMMEQKKLTQKDKATLLADHYTLGANALNPQNAVLPVEANQ